MKRYPIFFVVFFVAMIFCSSSVLFAQGLSRSTGIGARVSFWNITNHPTRIGLSDYGRNAVIDVSGAGAWVYFFSRMYNNWFLEFNLGAVGGVHQKHSNYLVTETEISAIVPFLLGLRYDLLSTRFPSKIQPYLSAGGGPYWTSSVSGGDFSMGGEQSIESNLKYGAYAGGGMNIVLASWFALNFDLKYHFVDFEFEKGYSGLEFGFGFNFMWGRKQEIFQVKKIKLVVSDIYPAYYQFYNLYPIALVTLKNMAGYPIEVNIKSYIENYSERAKESGFIRIEKGKTEDIPVTAIFGSQLQNVVNRKPAVLDLEIEARGGQVLKKEFSAQLVVHNRNAWNGEVDKLGFFVTPDNKDILNFTRTLVDKMNVSERKELEYFKKAQVIFDELQKKGIYYHRDPNIPFYKDDRVQYALETIRIGSGDCDDLVVLYTSLLESLGINTAFIEVKDPKKDIAHLYLMFDSGLHVNQGNLISSNEKRYVIRELSSNQKSIWIPVETTLIESGFEEAWKAGATEYLQEGVLRNGIAEGWVKIFDVE